MAGKFERLDRVIRKIDLFASGAFQRKAVESVGALLEQLAIEGARAGRNPRGRAWAIVKKTQAPAANLAAAASAGIRAIVGQLTATIAVRFAHAKANSFGASRPPRGGHRSGWRLPARAVLPVGGRLPPKWGEAINGEMRRVFGAVWDSL